MAEYYVAMRDEKSKDPEMWKWGPLHTDNMTSKKEAQSFLRKMRKRAKSEGYTSEEFKIFKGPVPKKKYRPPPTVLNFVPWSTLAVYAVGIGSIWYFLTRKD